MKVISVLGARPQFIKAAPISQTLRSSGSHEIILHTGQHYDENMSGIFFRDLGLPQPDYNLGVGSGSHGYQTGQMLLGIEEILIREKPDWVLVYGDTNSTLAGSLAAAKLNLSVAHVEAGLRSFNRLMPEEINRLVTDHLSGMLFCPSRTAVRNLEAEGITAGVHLVGDVMAAALASAAQRAVQVSTILEGLGLPERGYLLATFHRAENTDNPARLGAILKAFQEIREPVVFPVHPRTRKKILDLGFLPRPGLRLLEPLGYLDMVRLEKSARMILTDSGGIQKEGYWLSVPCVTLRDETEWVETVEEGWNILAGADAEQIRKAVETFRPPETHPPLYGEEDTARRIVKVLEQNQSIFSPPIMRSYPE
jgi:UDP-GlcNAc3NAcA epimerase